MAAVHVDNLMLIAMEGPKHEDTKIVLSFVVFAQNPIVGARGRSWTYKCKIALKKMAVSVCSVMLC